MLTAFAKNNASLNATLAALISLNEVIEVPLKQKIAASREAMVNLAKEAAALDPAAIKLAQDVSLDDLFKDLSNMSKSLGSKQDTSLSASLTTFYNTANKETSKPDLQIVAPTA